MCQIEEAKTCRSSDPTCGDLTSSGLALTSTCRASSGKGGCEQTKNPLEFARLPGFEIVPEGRQYGVFLVDPVRDVVLVLYSPPDRKAAVLGKFGATARVGSSGRDADAFL